MNILICDDLNEEAKALEKLIKEIKKDVNTLIFNKPADAINHIKSGMKIDLCFLDIIMPEMDGVILADKLRGENYKGEIVFLTTTNDYASESYKVKALSYLLKPPNIKNVTDILRSYENKRITDDVKGIPLKTKFMANFLFFREISYVEVIRHKVFFRLTDTSEIEVPAAFSETAPLLLEDERFAQCHRSFIVNMDEVSVMKGTVLIMKRGETVSVSKNYYQSFKKQYVDWVFKKEI